MNNSYKTALASGLMMSAAEKQRFASGIIAALNMPNDLKLQMSNCNASSPTLIPYLMDELAEQGMTATVGVNGTAIIHDVNASARDIHGVLTLPESVRYNEYTS